MKQKPLIALLVVLAAAFLWTIGPSVGLSFLLRSPIVLLRELAALLWPTSTLNSTAPHASIFTLRRTQLLLDSAAISPVGTRAVRVAPAAPTGTTSIGSVPSVPNQPSVLNPPIGLIQDTLAPTINQVLPPGTVPDTLPTITAPSVPSVPSVSVPDLPAVPSVTVPDVPALPSVTTPSVPSTPSVSVPTAPTPSVPSVGTPSVGGGTPSGGGGTPGVGGGGIGIKLP
ncbi:MAG TPA: hypothetical protein VNA31_01655 [bacterium]|nr:hypothetical protein [bacterium]